MITQEELQSMTEKIFGPRYKNISVEFEPDENMKVRWVRCGNECLDLILPDYLMDLPKELIKDLLNTIAGKMAGFNVDYSERFIDYVTSQEFRDKNAGTYMRRAGITESLEIMAQAEELAKRFDVGGIDGIRFGIIGGVKTVTSSTFKVVAIPADMLDTEDLPANLYAGIRFAHNEFYKAPIPFDDLVEEYHAICSEEVE